MELVGFLGYKIKFLLYFLGLLLEKKRRRIVRASYIATMNKGMGECFWGRGGQGPLFSPWCLADVIYESAVW